MSRAYRRHTWHISAVDTSIIIWFQLQHYHILLFLPSSLSFSYSSSSPLTPSSPSPKPNHPKSKQSIRSHNTQSDRQGFLTPNRPRNATPRQHQTRQQRHFHAVWLAVAHPEAAESVLCARPFRQPRVACLLQKGEKRHGDRRRTYQSAHRHPSRNRRDRPCAYVARQPSTGRQQGEEEGFVRGCGVGRWGLWTSEGGFSFISGHQGSYGRGKRCGGKGSIESRGSGRKRAHHLVGNIYCSVRRGSVRCS